MQVIKTKLHDHIPPSFAKIIDDEMFVKLLMAFGIGQLQSIQFDGVDDLFFPICYGHAQTIEDCYFLIGNVIIQHHKMPRMECHRNKMCCAP